MNAAALILEAGISYRQLDYWIRTGYVTSMHDGQVGKGHEREFTRDQVDLVMKIACLVKVGFTPAAAYRIAQGQRMGYKKINVGHGITLSFDDHKH